MTIHAPDPLREALIAALGAQYEVVRLLGKGGMGSVYLGRERLLDRPVAIKVLPHETADTSDARERFLREARIAARLSHPNIVPLYSFGEAGKTLFYVMGYVEGESLEQRLRREGRIGFDETRRILSELAGALEHAHAHGIVHRDIKPDNVLLEAGTGRAVLADFGIAKHQVSGHTLTHTGVIVGTPHYMSPEQLSGEREVDGRSDIYSLGIIGYRMLAGRLPFEGRSVQELFVQRLSREPVPLGTIVPDAPPDLDAAVMRCLLKDPLRRWPNAGVLRESLSSGDVETALPHKLENFPGSGSAALAMAYALTIASLLLYFATKEAKWLGWTWFAWVMAALMVIPFVRGRLNRIPLRRLWAMAFWPPKWWRSWWPRSFRRSGDVWEQLPRDVRRTRAMIWAAGLSSIALFFPLALFGVILIADNAFQYQGIAAVLAVGGAGGAFACGLVALAAFASSIRWQKRYQLSERDGDKLRNEPTWGSRFWTRPDIARLLSAHAATPLDSRSHESPEEILVALDNAAVAVSEPLRELVSDALTAARQVVGSINAIDEELRMLARDLDPAERERLQQRLTALGTTRPEEPAPTRQMRDLISAQLALINELSQRMQELSDRRAISVDLLRTLWLQVSALRAQHALDAASASEATGRIRELCRSADYLAVGEREVRNLLRPSAEAPTTPVTRGFG